MSSPAFDPYHSEKQDVEYEDEQEYYEDAEIESRTQSSLNILALPSSTIVSSNTQTLFGRLLLSISTLCNEVISDSPPLIASLRDLERRVLEVQQHLSCFSTEEQALFMQTKAFQAQLLDMKKPLSDALARLDALYRARNSQVTPIRGQLGSSLLELLKKNQNKIRDTIQLILQILGLNHAKAPSSTIQSRSPIVAAPPAKVESALDLFFGTSSVEPVKADLASSPTL